jgi:hypothetical protein
MAYGRNNRRNQTAPSAEDGKEAHHKLHSRQHKRDNERPVHPSRRLRIRVHARGEFVPKQVLHTRVLQPPHLHRVKVELELARGAVCDLLLERLGIFVALAVREKTDLVEVFELLGAGYAFEGGLKLRVGYPIGDNGFGVGCEVTCFCLSWC